MQHNPCLNTILALYLKIMAIPNYMQHYSGWTKISKGFDEFSCSYAPPYETMKLSQSMINFHHLK
jgi:hypothetical protein